MGGPPLSPVSTPPPGAPPRLADLLKQATAEAHRAAERHSFQRSLVRGRVSRAAFFIHQSGMLEIVRAVQKQLLAHPGPGWAECAEAMAAHGDRLQRDIEGLQDGDGPAPPSHAVRRLTERLGGSAWTPEATLGAFYVIEGSMNGNRFIRRALAAVRPALAAHLRYLDPYGPDQPVRWRQSRCLISQLGDTLADPAEAVRAARAAFAAAADLATEATATRPT